VVSWFVGDPVERQSKLMEIVEETERI
jgi:hypothetical protein